MITEQQYLQAKEIITEFNAFVTDELKGKAYKESYYKVNFYILPLTQVSLKKENLSQKSISKLNEYLNKFKSCKAFSKLKRTKSRGISVVGSYLHSHPFQYDIVTSTSKIVITVVTKEGCYKIVLGWFKDKKDKKKGKTPSSRLIKACEDANIDMSSYATDYEEGKQAAETIHKPEVRTVEAMKDKIYEDNIHHLDFHKFYPSGIAMIHPEFKPVFEKLAQEGDKDALDIGTRFLASKYADYSHAKLIKEGIDFMYKRFFEVYMELKNTNHKVLAFNTDGIWYQGDIFHGKYEGAGLGEWENDYTNVKKIRFKSAGLGAYEFIKEDNTYEPRYKGSSTYERVVPRENWVWGDIYKGSEISISWNSTTEQIIIKGID